MFFASLPGVRHIATVDFMRHQVGALRRATLGQPTVPVQRPLVSRFIVAGICGWLLWQPLSGKGEIVPPLEPATHTWAAPSAAEEAR